MELGTHEVACRVMQRKRTGIQFELANFKDKRYVFWSIDGDKVEHHPRCQRWSCLQLMCKYRWYGIAQTDCVPAFSVVLWLEWDINGFKLRVSWFISQIWSNMQITNKPPLCCCKTTDCMVKSHIVKKQLPTAVGSIDGTRRLWQQYRRTPRGIEHHQMLGSWLLSHSKGLLPSGSSYGSNLHRMELLAGSSAMDNPAGCK